MEINDLDIDQLFEQTLERLKRGDRPRYQFTEKAISELSRVWRLSLNDTPKLIKILCLIEHSAKESLQWEGLIIETLNDLDRSEEVLIHTLGASHRHVITRRMKLSERLPFEFLQCFEKLLEHESPEVLEWVLRTIEQMGSQSMMLKPKVLQRKPGIMRLFNKHLKNGHEIIEMLEKRWSYTSLN